MRMLRESCSPGITARWHTDMPTPLENLQAQYANAAARLAEMDAVPLDSRARMTYTDAGQSYDWNAYRAALQKTIDSYATQVEALLKAQQMIAGPFSVVGQIPSAGYCGY